MTNLYSNKSDKIVLNEICKKNNIDMQFSKVRKFKTFESMIISLLKFSHDNEIFIWKKR